MDAGELASRLL
jgi:hypothetical protein